MPLLHRWDFLFCTQTYWVGRSEVRLPAGAKSLFSETSRLTVSPRTIWHARTQMVARNAITCSLTNRRQFDRCTPELTALSPVSKTELLANRCHSRSLPTGETFRSPVVALVYRQEWVDLYLYFPIRLLGVRRDFILICLYHIKLFAVRRLFSNIERRKGNFVTTVEKRILRNSEGGEG